MVKKKNKSMVLQQAIVREWCADFLKLSRTRTENFIDTTIDLGLFSVGRDMYNQPAISITSKARLERFANFLLHFQKSNARIRKLTSTSICND